MEWLKAIFGAISAYRRLAVRMSRLEQEVEALREILQEYQEYAEESSLRHSTIRDKRLLLYQLRANLTKLRLRESAYGWSLGLSNQMDDIEREIEALEAELEE